MDDSISVTKHIFMMIKLYKHKNQLSRKLIYTILFVLLFNCNNHLYEDNTNNPIAIFDSFWNEVDRNYSFFTYKHIDWDSLYDVNSGLINAYSSDSALFNSMSNMLDCFEDAHLNIYTPLGTGGNTSFFSQFQSNQTDDIQSYFSTYKSINSCFQYGLINNTNIGYFRIKTFDGDNTLFEKSDSIVELLKNTDGIIIDIRSNKGGLISNAYTTLQSFIDTIRTPFQYRYRNGSSHNDFSQWEDYLLTPNDEEYYNKDVVVLTNRMTYSAAEWFVAMTKSLPNFITIGDTTGGGSGIPLLRELDNGWIVRISNSQIKLPSGNDFQFTGLFPDIPLWISEEEYDKNIDAILEKAIKVVTE